MKDILIATCGTSILTNARDIKNEILGERNYNQMTIFKEYTKRSENR